MEQSGPPPNENPREAKALFFSKDSIIPVIFALLLLGYCLYVCAIPPLIGRADTGEYARLMATIGVKHTSDMDPEQTHDYFWQFYSRNEGWTLSQGIRAIIYRFPASIFTIASLLLNALFGNTGLYNIVYLGMLHALGYSLAFLFFIRALTRDMNVYCRIFLCLIATLIYADSLFVVYFNSFHLESSFIISLLICIAVLISRSPKSPVCELSIFCLSLSKVQNIVFSVLYAFQFFSGSRRTKLAVFLIFVSIVVAVLGSREFRRENVFHSFCAGLLESNPEKDEVLSDFGLNLPEYSSFFAKAVNYHEASIAKEIRAEFYPNKELIAVVSSRVSIPKIAVYYVRHPKMFLSKCVYSIAFIRSTSAIPKVGNYLETDAAPMEQYTGIRFFSRYIPYLFVAIPLLSVVSMLVSLRRKRLNEFWLTAFLFAILPLTVVVAFIGDGFWDFARHLFPFYSLLSVLGMVSLGNLLRNAPPAPKV